MIDSALVILCYCFLITHVESQGSYYSPPRYGNGYGNPRRPPPAGASYNYQNNRPPHGSGSYHGHTPARNGPGGSYPSAPIAGRPPGHGAGPGRYSSGPAGYGGYQNNPPGSYYQNNANTYGELNHGRGYGYNKDYGGRYQRGQHTYGSLYGNSGNQHRNEDYRLGDYDYRGTHARRRLEEEGYFRSQGDRYGYQKGHSFDKPFPHVEYKELPNDPNLLYLVYLASLIKQGGNAFGRSGQGVFPSATAGTQPATYPQSANVVGRASRGSYSPYQYTRSRYPAQPTPQVVSAGSYPTGAIYPAVQPAPVAAAPVATAPVATYPSSTFPASAPVSRSQLRGGYTYTSPGNVPLIASGDYALATIGQYQRAPQTGYAYPGRASYAYAAQPVVQPVAYQASPVYRVAPATYQVAAPQVAQVATAPAYPITYVAQPAQTPSVIPQMAQNKPSRAAAVPLPPVHKTQQVVHTPSSDADRLPSYGVAKGKTVVIKDDYKPRPVTDQPLYKASTPTYSYYGHDTEGTSKDYNDLLKKKVLPQATTILQNALTGSSQQSAYPVNYPVKYIVAPVQTYGVPLQQKLVQAQPAITYGRSTFTAPHIPSVVYRSASPPARTAYAVNGFPVHSVYIQGSQAGAIGYSAPQGTLVSGTKDSGLKWLLTAPTVGKK